MWASSLTESGFHTEKRIEMDRNGSVLVQNRSGSPEVPGIQKTAQAVHPVPGIIRAGMPKDDSDALEALGFAKDPMG